MRRVETPNRNPLALKQRNQNHRETYQPSAMGVLVDADGRGPINPNLKVSLRHCNAVWFQLLAKACLRLTLSTASQPPVQLFSIFAFQHFPLSAFQHFSLSAFSAFALGSASRQFLGP